MLLIITSNSDKLFIGVNINDFKLSQTPKIGVLVFFTICGCDADFKSELRRNGSR